MAMMLTPRCSFGVIFSITHVRLDAGFASALHAERELTSRAVQFLRFGRVKPVDTMIDEEIQLSRTMVLAGPCAALDDDTQVAEGVFVGGDPS
jgi:hypothetical protein